MDSPADTFRRYDVLKMQFSLIQTGSVPTRETNERTSEKNEHNFFPTKRRRSRGKQVGNGKLKAVHLLRLQVKRQFTVTLR